MKQLHVINLAKMGGVERLFLQHIDTPSDDNHVIMCCSNKIGTEIHSPILYHRVQFVNRLSKHLSLRCPKFLRKYWILWQMSKISADVIIMWNLVIELPSKPKDTILLYYDHGASWRFTRDNKTSVFFSMLDGVIAASLASKRMMELRFNLPCRHLIVLNRIKNPCGIHNAKKTLHKPVRLGTASRLVDIKGITVSLLTVHELMLRGHDITIEIAGKGEYKKSLELLTQKLQLSDRVIFSGFQQEMSSFFNRIDIYMSTPITEPFGLSCMEALYYGVPVIFPLIDGQPEAIPNNVCGLGLHPTVSIQNHQNLIGMHINFPHYVYNPITDTLVKPKFLSHFECSNAVERLMVLHTYNTFSYNAQKYATTQLDYNLFQENLKNTIRYFKNQNNSPL
ncbi:Glycosyl transferase group 1 family protein [Candidatus Erwinia haradaeae]|uniref:Glycosyl transferase group 1 family protein n=1 Tax=Candidatus Erwinia haradaeae TaxID=1922217 RepID=A0A451DDJ7_9GAMM|nr:glycosyltransferase family 4 protein [Candidatus Erwinia haradaeae]VFP84491.1 Glycosyl transferase group 1 family protein [Candidatus Erwinia haradaeae]